MFQFVILANKILEADLLRGACLYKEMSDLNLSSSRFMWYLHGKSRE